MRIVSHGGTALWLLLKSIGVMLPTRMSMSKGPGITEFLLKEVLRASGDPEGFSGVLGPEGASNGPMDHSGRI